GILDSWPVHEGRARAVRHPTDGLLGEILVARCRLRIAHRASAAGPGTPGRRAADRPAAGRGCDMIQALGSTRVGVAAAWWLDLSSAVEEDRHSETHPDSVHLRPAAGDPALSIDSGRFLAASTDGSVPSMRMRIEGLPWDLHQQVLADGLRFARLRLGWADQRIDEVVLEVRITAWRRVSGELQHATDLEGRCWRHDLLTRVPAIPDEDLGPATPVNVHARALTGAYGLELTGHPAPDAGVAVADALHVDEDASVAEVLDRLARHGRGESRGQQDRPPQDWFVSRGRVHFGTWTAPVADGGVVAPAVDLSGGLIEAAPAAATAGASSDADPFQRLDPATQRYRLLLLGRPDIQCGDAVELPLDSSQTAGLAGGALAGGDLPDGGTRARFRVIAVSHRLSPQAGFASTVLVAPQPSDPEQAVEQPAADEAERTAQALTSQQRRMLRREEALAVGDVLEQLHAAEADHAWRPQRLRVRSGIDAEQALTNLPVRADVPEAAYRNDQVPYLTPYAWGATGLVLPHPPGTRVLLAKYRGDINHAVAAGCLWRQGQEPTQAQAGDWWLTLPVDPGEEPPEPDVGLVTSDLITADGLRSMRLRGVEITVGDELLPYTGERVQEAEAGSLRLRHPSGTVIAIEADGSISISAPGEDGSAGDITISAKGTLRLAGKAVEVQTATTMDVTGR
ncbi:MAG: hypothetical protein ACOCXJ_02480, partial [Planctomycetota bacterium]